jgi:putative phage-type endonuclease
MSHDGHTIDIGPVTVGWPPEAIVGRSSSDDADWRSDPEVRRSFLGGSDAAAALGLDPYRSPVELWLDKLGRGEPFDGNQATEWGNRLESAIAGWVEDHHPSWTIVDPMGATWRHPERAWQACTPDRFVHDPDRGWGNLQIKTAGRHTAEVWRDGDAPDQYRVQVAHEMAVLGLAWSALVCLVEGREPHVVIQDRDLDLEAWLVDGETRFWSHVTEGSEPPLLGHPAEASDLARVWVPVADAAVDLSPEAADALALYRASKAEIDRIEKHASRSRAIVEAEMGEATLALVDGQRVASWSARTELDLDRLRKENPALFELCLEPAFSLAALKRCQPAAVKEYRRVAGRTFRLITPKEPS